MTKEAVAVDLGGTHLRAGLIRDGKISRFIRVPTPKIKEELLEAIANSISEFFEYNIAGIGVGSPGPLKNGIIINPPNIALNNFDLKKFLEKRFNVKVIVENDAKCAAIGELYSGYGKGKKNFFVLTLGTGIGGGVIIDGKLYNKGDIGGELGNIYLRKERKFEELCGSRAVKAKSMEIFDKEMNLSELMKMKDKRAREIIEDISDALAQGIGSLINVFNPEIVVLAGGMREAGEGFLDLVRSRVGKYIFLPGKYEIVWSKLEEPGLLGAGLLIS